MVWRVTTRHPRQLREIQVRCDMLRAYLSLRFDHRPAFAA